MELSIVLVILGLLVGGVLSGQSLIRAAELRSVATEKDKFVIAINAFRDKYLALPGDMKNAYAFWGADCGADTTAFADGCNGNGDGQITEYFLIWHHLALAGLIEGTFVFPDTYGMSMHPDSMPKAKFPQAYWHSTVALAEEVAYSQHEMDTGAGANSNKLGLGYVPPEGTPTEPWLQKLSDLSNGEAWNIDTKIDDGRAQGGVMRGTLQHCQDAGTDYYQIAAEGADATGNCYLIWFLR